MPWVRFDDQFTIHRKVAGLSDAAFRLHVSAIFWCARNLMDGFLPEEDLDDVCARVRTPQRFAAECVKRGAWHDAREPCESEFCTGPVDNDGWVIHNYLEFQPSKEQVIRDRAASARRQKRWRDQHNGSSNAVTNGSSASAPSRSRPGVNGSAGIQSADRNARASPPVIEAIIKEIHATTGRDINDAWAAKIAATILAGQHPANLAAYVRQAIRNEPDPRKRFLPHY